MIKRMERLYTLMKIKIGYTIQKAPLFLVKRIENNSVMSELIKQNSKNFVALASQYRTILKNKNWKRTLCTQYSQCFGKNVPQPR